MPIPVSRTEMRSSGPQRRQGGGGLFHRSMANSEGAAGAPPRVAPPPISPACAWRRASCVGAAHEVLSPAYASIHHEAEVHDLIDAKTLLDACSLPLARPRRPRRQ